MITFSPTITTLLANQSIEVAYLIGIENYYRDINTGVYSPLRKTTFYSDIQMLNDPGGVRVYQSDGTIVSIMPPKFDSVVEKSVFEIIISDPEFDSIGWRESNLIGNYLEVRCMFVDTATGVPQRDYADTLLIYSGKIGNYSYNASTKELGENLLTIVGGSPVANLDYKKQYHLNKDFIRSRYPGDSCCDQISEGSYTLSLKWGKV